MNKSMIIASILSGVVTWIFMYLDAKLFDTPKSKFTYFKGISFVMGITAAVVYFMSPKSSMDMGMTTTGAGYGAGQVGGYTGAPKVQMGGYGGEEMLAGGMPPF